MAKNKIIGGVCALLVAASMLGATACGQGANSGNTPNTPTVNTSVTLNISDYAEDFEVNKSRTAVTAASVITKLGGAKFIAANDGLIYFSDTAGFGVYNLRKDRVVLSGLAALPVGADFSGVPVLRTSRTSGNRVVYDYTGASDGTKLLTDCVNYYPKATVAELTISGDTEKSEILILTADVLRGGEEERVTRYFKIVRDELTDEVEELTGVLGSGILTDDGYLTGGDYNVLSRTPVYGGENAVEGAISEYTYGLYGNTYVFYNGAGKETGSVRLADGNVLGFVANYMYYVTYSPVYPEATSGFNYIMEGDKYLYALNRYDIINNAVSTVAFDAVITNLKPLYNRTKKTYDAAVVTGYGLSNGVAYSGYHAFSHITDSELRSAYDLDRFGGFNGLYSLGEKTYLLGDYIVNEQLSVMTGAHAADVYPEQELVAFRNAGDSVGFTDFNGKIVLVPEYIADTGCADYSPTEPVKFYGDTAYMLQRTADSGVRKALVNKSGEVQILDDKELDTPSKTVGITVYGGFYLTLTAEANNKRTVYTYEFCAYNGAKLLTVTGESDTVRCEKVGDGYVVIEERSSGTTFYKIA